MNIDVLREGLPEGVSDEEIRDLAKESGIEISEPTEEDKLKKDAEEATAEQNADETEPPKTEEAPKEKEKTVAYGALHQERERRKALAAEVAALKTELETLRKASPVGQGVVNPPVSAVAAPNSPADEIDGIISEADKLARKAVGLENVSDDEMTTLQFTDPVKFRKYQALFNRSMTEHETRRMEFQRTFSENQRFLQELQTPDFPILYQYGVAELDDMKQSQARPINEAFGKIQQGVGTEKDREIAQKFVDKIRAKYTKASSMTDEEPSGPRVGSLGTGTSVGSEMSEAEIMRYFESGQYDKVPPHIMKKYGLSP